MRTITGKRRAVRPRTALVVDDDEATRITLAGLLEDERFEVITASTLERARYVLFESRHPVGVLVLDLAMNDGDGETLLGDVHANDDKSVPTVLISADKLRAEALADRYGIAFASKPFDINMVSVAFENDVRPQLRRTP